MSTHQVPSPGQSQLDSLTLPQTGRQQRQETSINEKGEAEEASDASSNASWSQLEDKWQRYLRDRHDLQALWATTSETEHVKYGTIVHDFEVEHKIKRENENKVLGAHEHWTEKRRYFSPRRRKRYQDALKKLSAAATSVQRARADRFIAKTSFHDHVTLRERVCGSAFKGFKVRLGDVGDEDARELYVHTCLCDSGYYCGHVGGDYIFRHRRIKVTSSTTPSSPAECSSFGAYTWQHPSCDSLLQNNEDELQETYEFCGLVPRTLREYNARFEVVCAKAIQMLESMITFSDADSDARTRPELRRCTSLEITLPYLVALYREWLSRVSEIRPKLAWVRQKMKWHPLILECAYLIMTIDSMRKGFMAMLQPLIETLRLATGQTCRAMMELYDQKVAKEAIHQLVHHRNVDRCIVISHEVEEVIPDYFTAPRFLFDPLHPVNRFNRFDCVNLASTLGTIAELELLEEGDPEIFDN